jgi:predicted nicotinamide N-methyase
VLAPDPALVLRRTRLQAPPAVPELVLHLGEDMTTAWEDLERELGQGAMDPPFWAFAWLGGQALARHVLDDPTLVRGRSVLDLATGSGLVALAAARAGAAHVLAVDVDPLAVAATGLNAEANGLDVEAVCADLLDAPAPAVDVLLAGDVCYDRAMTDRVLPWLRAAAAAGTQVLLGDPGRHYLPQHGLTLLSEHEVDTTRDLEGVTRKRVRVYALQGTSPAARGSDPA